MPVNVDIGSGELSPVVDLEGCVRGERVNVTLKNGDHDERKFDLNIAEVLPPMEPSEDAIARLTDIPTSVFESLWIQHYGERWVCDAPGERAPWLDTEFYVVAAKRLHAAGRLERMWLAGTGNYAYRLSDADR